MSTHTESHTERSGFLTLLALLLLATIGMGVIAPKNVTPAPFGPVNSPYETAR